MSKRCAPKKNFCQIHDTKTVTVWRICTYIRIHLRLTRTVVVSRPRKKKVMSPSAKKKKKKLTFAFFYFFPSSVPSMKPPYRCDISRRPTVQSAGGGELDLPRAPRRQHRQGPAKVLLSLGHW